MKKTKRSFVLLIVLLLLSCGMMFAAGKFFLQFRTFLRPRQIAAESVVLGTFDSKIGV